MNEVFLDMVAPREAAIDSEGFQLLSAIGREQVESKTGDLVFDPHLFTEKLVGGEGGMREEEGVLCSLFVAGDLHGWSSWQQQ